MGVLMESSRGLSYTTNRNVGVTLQKNSEVICVAVTERYKEAFHRRLGK